MDIGIVTFHFADNYGAVLQAYALKRALQKITDENVEIINYKSNYFDDAYSINPFKKRSIKGRIKSFLQYPVKRIQFVKFNDFRKNFLKIKSDVVRKIDGKNHDVLVTGSDQVWNLDITGNDFQYFFCDVDTQNTNTKLYSYAASSRNDFVTDMQLDYAKECLLKFKDISVREGQLSKSIQEKTDIQAKVVLDPVLLFRDDFWSKVALKPTGLPKRYILFYGLEKNDKLESVACKLSKDKNIDVIIAHPLGQKIMKYGKMRYDIGPREFLYLVQHADCVVSNSFHAFAFSCIFSKQIYFDYVKGLSNRVNNLIDILHLNSAIGRVEDVMTVKADLASNRYYKEWYKKSYSYLENMQQ